ncbi:MAG: hypothetical protein WC869_14810 [Phycisphaerae bacterium]
MRVKKTTEDCYCIVLQHVNNRTKDDYDVSITIDPTRGFTISSITDTMNGQVEFEGHYEYYEAGGAWILVGAKTIEPESTSGDASKITMTVDKESLTVNEPIAKEVFSVKALGIRKGSRVVNEDTGEEYVYNDIPLSVKIMVCEAQENLLRLPENLEAAASRPTSGCAEISPSRADSTANAQDTCPVEKSTWGFREYLVLSIAVAAVVCVALWIAMRLRK